MLRRTVVLLFTSAESAAGFMGTCCSSGVKTQANFDSRSLCLLHHPLSTKGRLGTWNIRGNTMADIQLQGGSAKAASHDHSDATDIDEIWMYFANKEIGTRHLIRQPQRSQSIRWSSVFLKISFFVARARTHTDQHTWATFLTEFDMCERIYKHIHTCRRV